MQGTRKRGVPVSWPHSRKGGLPAKGNLRLQDLGEGFSNVCVRETDRQRQTADQQEAETKGIRGVLAGSRHVVSQGWSTSRSFLPPTYMSPTLTSLFSHS